MSLFKKKDDHPGSGIDKPQPKGLVEAVVEKVKAVSQPEPVMPPKGPVAP
jgi:hypothetical protein